MSKQFALDELVKAIHEFRKFTHQPLTLRGSDYAAAIQALNKAIDRAEGLFAIFHTATGAEPPGGVDPDQLLKYATTEPG